MKRLQLWTTSLLLSATSVFAATDFLSLVPEDAIFALHITDGSTFMPRWESSPIGEAIGEIDFKQFIQSLEEASEESDEEFDSDAVTAAFEQITDLQNELTGASCFYIGNLSSGLKTLQANKKVRDEILGLDTEESDEEELSDEEEAKLLALDRSDVTSIMEQFFFLADVDDQGQAVLSQLEKWTREELQPGEDDETKINFEEIEIDGIKVYQRSVSLLKDDGETEPSDEPDLLWAVSDSVLAITFSEASMREKLASLREFEGNAIDESELVRDALGYTERGDMTMIVNFPLAHDLIASVLPEQTAEQVASPMAMNPVKALNWFGIQSMRPYVVSLQLADEGIRGKGHFGFTSPTVLSELFIQQHDGTYPEPAFIHRDVMSVSAGHYRLADAYQTLETRLASLSPQAAAGLGMVRMMGSGQLGIDFKTQLLDHFDSRFIMIQDLDIEKFRAGIEQTMQAAEEEESAADPIMTPGQSFLFAMGVKNKTDLESSLKTLSAKFTAGEAAEPTDYKGVAIHVPAKGLAEASGNNPEDIVCYAWLDDYLLVSIGSGDQIKKAIDASQDDSLSLWSSPKFTEAISDLNDGANYLEYSDQERAMELVGTAFEPLQAVLASQGMPSFPDLTPLTKLFSSSVSIGRIKGLVTEMEAVTLYQEQ